MNYELIEEKYLECINKKYDLSILDINFLINKIEKEQNAI
jgi:hypothetical protein